VRPVGDVLVSAPEDGVVHGGRELGDATTDRFDEFAPDDRAVLEESPLGGPLADVLVDPNVSPGITMAPSMMSAISWMFVTRF
jgi:hypothetical protein